MVFCLLWSNSVYVECVFVEAGSFFRPHYLVFLRSAVRARVWAAVLRSLLDG